MRSEELIEYMLSSDGQLIQANSRETHRMQLTANRELGSNVESFIELKLLRTTSDTTGSVEQRKHNSLDEAVDSLMDWYRVFELPADIDGEISDLKQHNTTVRRTFTNNFFIELLLITESIFQL